MYIANELKNVVPLKYKNEIRESFVNNVFDVLHKYIEDKSMFSMQDFTLYYLDEYELDTNCNKDIFSTMYLEINQPLNYRTDKIKKKKNKDTDKYIIPELYLSLNDFKKGLHDAFVNHFDGNTIVWQDKFGICLKSTTLEESGENYSYYFRVIPALTHYNTSNTHGLVYYSNNEIQIEYPESFIKNYAKKNKQTKDKFRQTVLIFKNILLKEKNIDRLPSEIIETLVYNVPNNLLKSDSKDNMLNIINFIRNNPLKSFRTIDEQDYAFSSLYRSMSIIYSKHILKIIEKYLTKI